MKDCDQNTNEAGANDQLSCRLVQHAGMSAKFPLLAHKGALMGAFRCATSRKGHVLLDADGTFQEVQRRG